MDEEEGYICSKCDAEFDITTFEYPSKGNDEVWFCPYCGSELEDEDDMDDDDDSWENQYD